MSAAAAPLRGARLAGRPGSLVGWLRRHRVPLAAFALSRLVSGVAGAVGVLTLTKHDGSAAALARLTLGPVGNVLAGSVDRFDASFYLDIAQRGFGSYASGRVAFFPLYPLLIRMLTPVLGSAVISGAAISAGTFAAALILLHRLTALELGQRAADVTVLLLAFAPLSFFFTAIYTESLFLALSVATMLAARGGRWRLACALGSLATLTRPVGVLLAGGLVIARWRDAGRLERGAVWALALPAALLGYMAALVSRGLPWMAPFSVEAKWGRETIGPVGAIAAAVWSALRGVARVAAGGGILHPQRAGALTPGAESVVLLVVLVISLVALVRCLRTLPLQYGAFSAAVLLVTLSSPRVGQPLWSFDRYTMTIFPLWMAAGGWLAERPRVCRAVLAAGSLLLVFYTLQFSSWSFVA